MTSEPERLRTYSGGCHCGAVRYEAEAPASLAVLSCNCSICRMTGYLHVIVPADRFRLLTPWENLETYTFNTETAKHWFCKRCGIKSFYRPRSHPEGYSLHLQCLDPDCVGEYAVTPFDGANWEAARGEAGI